MHCCNEKWLFHGQKHTHTYAYRKYLTDTHSIAHLVLTLEKFVAHLLLAYLDAQKGPGQKLQTTKRA